MRTLCLLLGSAAVVAGCTTSPPPTRTAAGEQHLQKLLAGKTAAEPRSCLPTFRSSNMVVIDDNTVLFRDGARVWRSDMRGSCSRLGSGFYTIVTRSFGGRGPCSGDIAEVADLTTGTTVGSCAWGDFVPYTGGRP